MRSHRDLVVWQKAMDLVDLVYLLARSLPVEEMYGLRSQMTRAAVSVPANIAEGQTRATSKDFANFLVTARSSLMELETLMMVAVRQRYFKQDSADPLMSKITELSKMLTVLRARVLQGHRRE